MIYIQRKTPFHIGLLKISELNLLTLNQNPEYRQNGCLEARLYSYYISGGSSSI